MKLRSVLSGIAALLLVGVFYSFAFCMVDDVTDAPISMDYYYSTETDSASKDYSGKAATEFDPNATAVPEDKPSAEAEIEKKAPSTNRYAVVDPNAMIISANVAGAETDVATQVPEEVEDIAYADAGVIDNRVLAEDEEENEILSSDEELLYDDSTDEPLEDDSNVDEQVAEMNIVYAAGDDDDRLLSKETVATVVPGASTIMDYEFDPLEGIPTVPAEEVTVTTLRTEKPIETIASTTAGIGADISTAETLSITYGGSVHTMNSFELICGIVNNEISHVFGDEAIKAQAIAAYSYIKYNNLRGIAPSVLVKANPDQKIIDLVSTIWGQCCYYNGEIAQTVYMASSSGFTASSVNVWGGDVPYLRSVECPFDAQGDPNYGVVTKFSEEVVRNALRNYFGIALSDNPSHWLNVTQYVDGNYVAQLSIDGQASISGHRFRESVLNYQLKSAAFDVYYSDGYFYFTTYGYGHGVGMSQNGANALSKMGYSYIDILKYYYTGIDVL